MSSCCRLLCSYHCADAVISIYRSRSSPESALRTKQISGRFSDDRVHGVRGGDDQGDDGDPTTGDDDGGANGGDSLPTRRIGKPRGDAEVQVMVTKEPMVAKPGVSKTNSADKTMLGESSAAPAVQQRCLPGWHPKPTCWLARAKAITRRVTIGSFLGRPPPKTPHGALLQVGRVLTADMGSTIRELWANLLGIW